MKDKSHLNVGTLGHMHVGLSLHGSFGKCLQGVALSAAEAQTIGRIAREVRAIENEISMVPPLVGKQFKEFEAAAQEVIAEFAHDPDTEIDDLDGASLGAAEEVLDKAADEAVMKELNQLEWLLGHSTYGDWVQSPHSNDAVIVAGVPSADIPDEVVRLYGGNLVFESARLADREFILALRRWAPGLLAIARGHEAEKIANDMLVKSLIRNEEALKTSRALCDEIRTGEQHYRELYHAAKVRSSALRERMLDQAAESMKPWYAKLGRAFKRFIDRVGDAT